MKVTPTVVLSDFTQTEVEAMQETFSKLKKELRDDEKHIPVMESLVHDYTARGIPKMARMQEERISEYQVKIAKLTPMVPSFKKLVTGKPMDVKDINNVIEAIREIQGYGSSRTDDAIKYHLAELLGKLRDL